MRKPLRNEAIELFEKSRQTPGAVITKADFSGLPDPVQRSLRYARPPVPEAILVPGLT